jgi:hypothetical protein
VTAFRACASAAARVADWLLFVSFSPSLSFRRCSNSTAATAARTCSTTCASRFAVWYYSFLPVLMRETLTLFCFFVSLSLALFRSVYVRRLPYPQSQRGIGREGHSRADDRHARGRRHLLQRLRGALGCVSSLFLASPFSLCACADMSICYRFITTSRPVRRTRSAGSTSRQRIRSRSTRKVRAVQLPPSLSFSPVPFAYYTHVALYCVYLSVTSMVVSQILA